MCLNKYYYLDCDFCGRLITDNPLEYRKSLRGTISEGVHKGWYITTFPCYHLATEVESICPECWKKLSKKDKESWIEHAKEFWELNKNPLTVVNIPRDKKGNILI